MIRIDQPTHSNPALRTGVAGNSRPDLEPGKEVELHWTGAAVSTYLWSTAVSDASGITLSDAASAVARVNGLTAGHSFNAFLDGDGSPVSYVVPAHGGRTSNTGPNGDQMGAGAVPDALGNWAPAVGERKQFGNWGKRVALVIATAVTLSAGVTALQSTAPTADEKTSLGQLDGASQGTVFYSDGTGRAARLAPGASGQVLSTQGAGADPLWVTGGGGGGVTDHGALTGLADDDHAQYLLADGTRELAGNMSVAALVTIDGRDVGVDGAKLDGVEALADVTDTASVTAAGALLADGTVALSGSMSVSAAVTIDGRDVGVDGAKLDGVEAGADVTDAVNVAASGALMSDGSAALTGGMSVNAAVTIDGRDLSVDGAKLDGVEALADVTDATNVDAAGAVLHTDVAGINAGALIRTGSESYGVLQHNLVATVAPGVTDDTSAGYTVGSLWIDVTADDTYQCVDATASAAVWAQTNGAGGGGSGDVTAAANFGTDNRLIRSDGTLKGVQSSDVDIRDDGSIVMEGTERDLVFRDGQVLIESTANNRLLFRTNNALYFFTRTSPTGIAFNEPPFPNANGAESMGTNANRWGDSYERAEHTTPQFRTTNGTLSADFTSHILSTGCTAVTLPADPDDGMVVELINDTVGAVTVSVDAGDSSATNSFVSSLTSGSRQRYTWRQSDTTWY